MAELLPDDLTVTDFAPTVSLDAIAVAEKRLCLCSACPEHGGACDTQYESRHGEEPHWDGTLSYRECAKWTRYQLRQKLVQAGVPFGMLEKTIETFDPKNAALALAKKCATAYVQSFSTARTSETPGLFFFGGTGVGKTHVVVAVLRELLARGRIRDAAFYDAAVFLDELRDAYGVPGGHAAITARARTVEILVLDDLGAHATNEWVREQLGALLNYRWSNQLPVLITSNAMPQNFTASLGARSVSRLAAMCVALPFKGTDQRLTDG